MGQGRFPPSARVRKRAEFQEIQSRGRRISTPHFTLLVYSRTGQTDTPPRLGVTASRRIGGAVLRNRAKRLIREAFRVTSELWEPGIDLVVIAKKPPGTLGLDDVVGEWRGREKTIRRQIREARKDGKKRESELAEPAQPSQTRPGIQ